MKRIETTPFALMIFAVALVGCPGLGTEEPPTTVDEIPEEPTWEEDVLPILNEYCNECHSDPPQQTAPATIRLDVCEDVGGKLGAKNQAFRIVERMINHNPTSMPPSTFGRDPGAAEDTIVQRWVDQGANCGTAGNNGMNDGGMDGGNNGMNNGMDAGMDMAMEDMNVDPPAFSEVADILRNNCSCHNAGAGGMQFGMDPSDQDIATALMGDSNNGDIVVLGDPDNSRLYIRPSSGTMPPNAMLPQSDVDTIGDWIEFGSFP